MSTRVSTIFEHILPAIAWLLVVCGLILQKLAEMKLGVYRDVIYRNQLLQDGILNVKWLVPYQLIAMISIMVCTIIFLKNTTNLCYYIWVIVANLIAFLMLHFYHSVDIVAFPIILLTVMVLAVVQFLRYIVSNKKFLASVLRKG